MGEGGLSRRLPSGSTKMIDQLEIARHFDRRAASYAEKYNALEMRHLYEFEKLQRLEWTLQWLESFAAQHPATRLLDVGCGQGQLIRRFLKRQTDCQALGIDLSTAMIQHAQKECRDLRARWQVCPASEVSGAYDVVTSLGVVGYQEDQLEFVRLLADRVAPGGWLVLSFGNRRSLLRKARQSAQSVRQLFGRQQPTVRFRPLSFATLQGYLDSSGFRCVERRWLAFGLGFEGVGRHEVRVARRLEAAFSCHSCGQWLAQVGLVVFAREA